MIEWLFLVMALSFDAFLVSITYGLDNIDVYKRQIPGLLILKGVL